jgi:DNA-binding winged helix-turn-helix (wHTH) protein/tetratricopeptide (TPR) repeat protein
MSRIPSGLKSGGVQVYEAERIVLAHEPDFVLGRLRISPARRELVRDDGAREVLEHRVIQVLVALAKAAGGILTRDELTLQCWEGRVVGEDAINRVISHLRKAAGGIGVGSFDIETITKVGYRLTGEGIAGDGGIALVVAAATSTTRRWFIAGLALFAVLAVAGLYWSFARRTVETPTVAVAATDKAALSPEMARDLLVRLGTLQGNAATNIRLLDSPAESGSADLRFTVNGAERQGRIYASAALVSGPDETMLWSEQFEQPAGSRSDLEESLAFAAARVLGCAIEEQSGRHGHLSQDLRRTYLNACASLAEVGWDNSSVLPQLRRVTLEAPSFRPAWARLLTAQADYVDYLEDGGMQDSATARSDLSMYIKQARTLDPQMAEVTLAELTLTPNLSVARSIFLADRAKAQDPRNPAVFVRRSQMLQRAGRMADAVEDAAQAAELDPLSPYTRTNLIETLFWAGQADRARTELAKAERLWPGTRTVRDAEFSIELRSGAFDKALESVNSAMPAGMYPAMRHTPSDANVARFVDYIRRQHDLAMFVFGLQALGEVKRADEFYALTDQFADKRALAGDSYVFFRPWFAEIRRDRRFISFAAQLGLVDYWQKSGNWPDFCSEPDLPYDCEKEAAKLAA